MVQREDGVHVEEKGEEGGGGGWKGQRLMIKPRVYKVGHMVDEGWSFMKSPLKFRYSPLWLGLLFLLCTKRTEASIGIKELEWLKESAEDGIVRGSVAIPLRHRGNGRVGD